MNITDVNLDQTLAVVVFPSYNEVDNLDRILGQLGSELLPTDLVIISDDSGVGHRAKLEIACLTAMESSPAQICFSYAPNKSGRGAAVRRAFQDAQMKNPKISKFLEADSDGSHRVEDILSLLRMESDFDLIIGSRYSRGSKISGWPLSRRVFSRALNLTIPRILSVNSRDLTNGLRRYSSQAVSTMLAEEAKNTGFIYLSESAYLISRHKMSILDIPIHFENRVHGESTVGRRELSDSLAGIVRLISLRVKHLARR